MKKRPTDKFSLLQASMMLRISRDTLRRRLHERGIPIIPGRKYTRMEITDALVGTKQYANLMWFEMATE